MPSGVLQTFPLSSSIYFHRVPTLFQQWLFHDQKIKLFTVRVQGVTAKNVSMHISAYITQVAYLSNIHTTGHKFYNTTKARKDENLKVGINLCVWRLIV